MPGWRFPAEWEDQSAVLLAWPHAGTDWAERLVEVETTYTSLVKAIAACTTAIVCVADDSVRDRAERLLYVAGVPASRVRYVPIPYDDTWLRDSGPITLRDGNAFHFLDFRFTGWGGKYQAGRDDALVAGLAERGLLSTGDIERIDFALEGGGIETDGRGTLMTTWRCLSERHPDKSREEIETVLLRALRQDRVLWLDHGYLEGDDTDAHIDTLARFASCDAIVFQACDDDADPHHAELAAMAAEIAALRTTDGKPYRLFPLPWARPIIDGGRRLAASYANFLITDGAVLIPAYEDPADDEAARVIAQAFPGRRIVQVPCRALIWQNGSLHCVTMQIPQGAIH
jgi:agmatine/peptidylarginine deiminase